MTKEEYIRVKEKMIRLKKENKINYKQLEKLLLKNEKNRD